MDENILITFLKNKEIAGIKLGTSVYKTLTILGQPEDISKMKNKVIIYSYYYNLLQITFDNELVCLIAFEFDNESIQSISKYEISKLFNFLTMHKKQKNILELLKNSEINFEEKNADVFYVNNNIAIIFKNGELKSLQISNFFL